jgi:endonuclease/exonuclease/phosphatase family metal-dependent hydrolase
MRRIVCSKLTLLLFSVGVCAIALNASSAGATEPIRVMSFNIRYGTAKDGNDAWDKRREFVLDTIRDFKPDLLGTQEVLDFQADYLVESLPDHALVGVGRDDGKRKGEFSALLYNKKRFKEIDSGTYWLSETPDEPGSKSWDSSLPRVATWAKLRDLQPGGQEIVFVNTHWDHVGKRAREEAGKIIHTWMGESAANQPTIVTGDFNATEDHPGIAALLSSKADSLKLVDVYRKLHPEAAAEEATFNGFQGRTKGRRIDFIFASPVFKPLEAAIDRTSRTGKFPSDHFPVTAVLELRK